MRAGQYLMEQHRYIERLFALVAESPAAESSID